MFPISRSAPVFNQRLKWKQIVCSSSLLNINRSLSNTSIMNGAHANGGTNDVQSGVNRRVLAIQSHVVHGYVGNKSATFPLQVCSVGSDCWRQQRNFNGCFFVKSIL